MDLRILNTFIQVAEANSFTRAGERLGYAQPTVSFQIKQLEEQLGVRLFDRIGHTVRLTDEGRAALRHAQQICKLCAEMTNSERLRNVAGTVRVGMADSLCAALVEERFHRFREDYPHIHIVITTAGTNELFRLLDHNEVDVVCTLDNHICDMNYVVADEQKMGAHFVVPAGHALAAADSVCMKDLLKETFLLTEKNMSYRRLLDEWLARESQEIQPVLEIGSARLICELVEKGVGVSFLPDYVTGRAVREGRVVRLTVREFEPDLWKQLLYHREKWVSEQMQAVITHLSEPILE